MNRVRVLACVSALLVAGCASRGTVRQLADDVHAVQSEVGALRQSQEDMSRRLTEMASANRTASARTAELQSSVTGLKADVERLTAQVQATDAALKTANEALARATATTARPTATAATAAPVAAAPVAAPPPAPVPPPASDPPRARRAGSAESAFAAGLSNFRKREYGQAVLDFLDVVTKHPKHELASTSQYWIGEAYYLQRDYRQALIEFERAAEWAAPHPKVPDALLKAGLCHSELRESTQAQQAWRRVVREFPESPAADEARLLLDGKKSVRRQ